MFVFLKNCLFIPRPGICNIIYEVFSYKYTATKMGFMSLYLHFFSGISPESFRLGCSLVVFRNILNEYTTGICVTASAFFRYCYVCHPTRQILTERRLRGISIFIALFAVICLVGNMVYFAFVLQAKEPLKEGLSWYEERLTAKYSRVDFFLYKCSIYPFRYGNRLVFDAITCLGIPGVMSGFFYVNVIYRLATRNRDQLRNRNLSIAFVVGWLIWIVTWVPHYWMTSQSLPYTRNSDLPFSFEFKRYLVTVSANIFLIYSHLNPILLIFVLTPFQKVLSNIRAFLFMSHKRGYGISKGDCTPDDPIEGHNRWKEKQKKKFRVSLILLSTSLVVSIFTCCYASFKTEKSSLDFSERMLHLKTSTLTDINKIYLNFIMDTEDLGSEIMTRKSICAAKHGVLNFHYQRCYFVETYPSRGLNLSEQIDFCKSQNAVLSYPRNKGEVRFLWNVYIEAKGEDNLKQLSFHEDWFLHTGFQLKTRSKTNPEFISADNLFIVSGSKDFWLKEYFDYRSTYKRAFLPFFGPAVCITASKFLIRCRPEIRKSNSVCSVDLLIQPKEEIEYIFYFTS